MEVVMFFFVLGISISECSDVNDDFQCRTRCEDENATSKSDFVPSLLHEADDMNWDTNSTAPAPESIQLSYFLYKNLKGATKLGLNITWRQKGYAVQNYVDGYEIELHRQDTVWGVTDLSAFMVLKGSEGCSEYIRSECLYRGKEEELNICPGGIYEVYVQASPTSLPGNNHKELNLKLKVPGFRNYSKITCEIFLSHDLSVTGVNYTVITNSTNPGYYNNNIYHSDPPIWTVSPVIQLSVTATILSILIIIAIIIGLKFRRPMQTADLQEVRKNILIVAHDLTTEVNDIATKLSRKFETAQVQYNGWETNSIANIGFGTWMAKNISSAHIIVYICPMTEERQQEFGTLYNTLINMENTKTGCKKILVLHLGSECLYKKCIARMLKRRAFRLEKEWKTLCEAINRQMKSEKGFGLEKRALLPTTDTTEV